MKLYFSILLLFLLSACFDDKLNDLEPPKNLIPKEKMASLYYEMTLLESHVQITYLNAIAYHKLMVASGDDLLKKKGITPKQYRSSFEYYTSKTTDLEIIRQMVIKRMERRLIYLNQLETDSISK